jgi:hypothetical protein
MAAMAFNLTRAAGTSASVFHAKATTSTIRRQLIADLTASSRTPDQNRTDPPVNTSSVDRGSA